MLSLSFNLSAQKKHNSQDSITVFYDSLFSKLKAGYLYKDTVDWIATEAEVKINLPKYNDFKSSLNEIEPLFRRIAATHCAILYKENKYSISAVIPPDSYSDQWKKKYITNPGFETKVIEGKYGYILMPAINFTDTRQKNVNKISQGMYDQVAELKNKNELEGWIIDLRFNTGGNSWPMLLALYDLLGDNAISGTLDVNKKLVKMASLSQGNYLVDSVKQFWIKPKGKLLDKAKVALLTGVVTASSGEVVAMAFKGRPNSIIIGENTLGFTSANYGSSLPFNIIMTITKDYNGDRNGNYYERIIPDIKIVKQDNFDNLLLDKNIQEAIKFINGKE
jgi:hypothetical protein